MHRLSPTLNLFNTTLPTKNEQLNTHSIVVGFPADDLEAKSVVFFLWLNPSLLLHPPFSPSNFSSPSYLLVDEEMQGTAANSYVDIKLEENRDRDIEASESERPLAIIDYAPPLALDYRIYIHTIHHHDVLKDFAYRGPSYCEGTLVNLFKGVPVVLAFTVVGW